MFLSRMLLLKVVFMPLLQSVQLVRIKSDVVLLENKDRRVGKEIYGNCDEELDCEANYMRFESV